MEGSGFGVQDSGDRVQGSGFRETETPSIKPVFFLNPEP
jgi:hypothetical protein